jgi:glycosyltransferase involved in cell wall biosynthesis
MHIAMLVSAALPPREGIGFYVWNLSQHLVELGHSVQIITRGGPRSTTREVIHGITVWRPPFLPLYPFHVHWHSLFVSRLIKRLEPELDLLHLHSPLVRYPGTDLPSIVTCHTPMKADARAVRADTPLGMLTKLQLPVSIALESAIIRRVGRVAAVAASVANELREYGVDPHRVEVLGNGADTSIFRPQDGQPQHKQDYILTVGRLGPRKGLEDLIACAAHVVQERPHLCFYIAGDGPYRNRLERRARALGVDRHVTFLGHIGDRGRLVELYPGAAAYLHPAHYEGLPTVLLEAMACGRPVIATSVSGALDVIRDGRNGLLVSPRAPAGLAKAVLKLLENPALGARLGAAARATVARHFSWCVVTHRYVRAYEALLR